MKPLLTQHELDRLVHVNLVEQGKKSVLVGQRVVLLWLAQFDPNTDGAAGVDATVIQVHDIVGENAVFTLAVDSSYVGLYSVLEKIELYPVQKVDQEGQYTGWALCFPDEKEAILEVMDQDLEPFDPDTDPPTVH